MAKILLIEDDTRIQELIAFNLKKEGYTLGIASDGINGLEIVKRDIPDLILLDLMLPGLDGFEVCKAIRADKRLAHIPIIMLSARDEVVDKVIGLELGADDYITKPFSPRELIARVRVRLRQEKKKKDVEVLLEDNKALVWGDLEMFPFSYKVTIGGQLISFTAKEFELLHLFLKRPSHVFTREYLLQEIWGYTDEDTRTVDVHICNLRNKLKSLGSVIESVRGIGYRFTS